VFVANVVVLSRFVDWPTGAEMGGWQPTGNRTATATDTTRRLGNDCHNPTRKLERIWHSPSLAL